MQSRQIKTNRAKRKRAAVVLGFAVSTLTPRLVAAGTANWSNPATGNWTDPANWSTNPIYPRNGLPTAADTYQAIISGAGSAYTLTLDAGSAPGGAITVDSLTVNSADATVIASSGTFRATGGLVINAGKFRLYEGTLKSTIVSGADNSFFPSIGTLDNVTFKGNVVSADGFPTYGEPLNVINGLTLDNAFFPTRPNVVFGGNQTVSGNGNVFIGSFTGWTAQGTLTIAPGILIHGGGNLSYYNGSLINKGTIRAEPDNNPFTFTTSASTSNRLINQGLIESVAGARLEFDGSFTNSGTIRANGGSVLFSVPSYKTSDLGMIQTVGGTVGGSIAIGGGLDNHNATLFAAPTTGSLGIAGTITGGTLATSGGAEFSMGRYGWIYDVTLSGTLSLYPEDLANHGTLNFKNLTLAGGEIHLKALAPPGSGYGPNAHMKANGGAQTISGTGQIIFDGVSDANSIEPDTGTITLASGITVKTGSGGGSVGYGTQGILNLGAILSQTPGRTIILNNVTNQGSIQASNGGTLSTGGVVNAATITTDAATLNLSNYWKNATGSISALNNSNINLSSLPDSTNFGNFSVNGSSLNLDVALTTAQLGQIALTNSTLNLTSNGIIDNTGSNAAGATLNLGPSNALHLGSGRINGGTVMGQALQASSGTGYLKGVTLALPVNVLAGGVIRVESGMTLKANQISMASGVLQFMDAGGLNGTGEVVFDGASSGNFLTPVGGLLTIAPGITIRTGAAGGSAGSATATLSNNGLISAQTAGKTITLLGSINNAGVLEAKNGGSLIVSNLQNSGTVRVSAGGTAAFSGTWSSNKPIELNDGALTLGGTFSSASLGTIVRLGSNSTLTLNGTLTNTNSTLDLAALGPIILSSSLHVVGGTINGNATSSLSGSGALQLQIDGVTNHAPINLSAGATLTLSGNWTNDGGVTVADSTLNLGGNFTRAGLGTINRTGGIVNFSGTLDNTGQTLLLDDKMGTWTVQNGTINGGTVRTIAPARLYIPSGNNLSLNGVVLDSDLSLEGGQLKVSNGLSLSGRKIFGNGTITFTGSAAQSLQNGTIGFFDGGTNTIENPGPVVARLAPDLLVRGEQLSIVGGNAGIINQGTIRALAPGGTLLISNVINQGTIDIQTSGILGTNLSPSNSARIVLNSSLVQFSGPRTKIFGSLDNTAAGRMLIMASADATFNGPVSGVAGTEVRVETGGLATFGTNITGPIAFTGPGTVSFMSGNSSVGPLTSGSVAVQSQALIETSSIQTSTLTVNGELDIRVTPNGSTFNKVNKLNFGADGFFSVGNNGLAVDYDSSAASPLADIRSKIVNQQLAGAGDFAAIDETHLGLGYAEASRVLGPSGGVFMGQNVDGSTVLVRYTVLGDANLDGVVNFNDLVAVAQHYGGPGMSWADGDSNNDGVVDFQDLVKVAQNYNGSLAGPLPGATPEFDADLARAFASVPEPSSLCFLIGVGAGLLRRRVRPLRRRTSQFSACEGGCHA